ncbi:hypothetical protein [Leptolyngbya sp. FACHB-261]|nr:hypothetical protein [Leptolyngbya sp. FACHB-261]MBD2104710.1 hypothetical protein [Leptolyngbya sp. FACHB-261]
MIIRFVLAPISMQPLALSNIRSDIANGSTDIDDHPACITNGLSRIP